MFPTDQAPGVYYQTVDAGSPPVTPLRTDITGFVGIAARGPVDVPVPVESWQQFVSWFGGCTPVGFLAYAVRGFLENGGRRCWVVRAASKDPATGCRAAALTLPGSSGPVWSVEASSPGIWGDRLTVSLRETNRAQVHAGVHDPEGRWSQVPSVAGLDRGTLVRVSQPGSPTVLRVVSAVDPGAGRVHWTHPEPGAGLPYDRPLTGFDPNRPVLLESVEHRLTVSEDGRLLRVHAELSLVPEHPRYGPAVLAPLRTPDTRSAPEPVVLVELRPDLTLLTALDVADPGERRLTGGRDGLATLRVDDLVGEPFSPEDSDEAVAVKSRGLRALERNDEIGLLAVPDVLVRLEEPHLVAPLPPCVPDPCLDPQSVTLLPAVAVPLELPPVFSAQEVYSVQAAMVDQCERRRDRFALLDPPYDVATDPVAGIRGVLDWRARFDTAFAALSHPWLKVADPIGGPGAIRLLPPSGHVAGLVAGTDLSVGVHRAPANRPLVWALGASVTVSEAQHGLLNQSGVNIARTVGGRGLRLLGARTTSSDPDWRFVNVRRLMSMIEKALSIGLQWAAFEPNGFVTRARAMMAVTFFLDSLHEQGMFAGATAEESFYVRCDLDNNPPEERDLGRLLVEVGIAPAQPFEFVVVRVGRVSDSVEVRTGGVRLGATGTGV
jgi:phage tail sheath protein FI